MLSKTLEIGEKLDNFAFEALNVAVVRRNLTYVIMHTFLLHNNPIFIDLAYLIFTNNLKLCLRISTNDFLIINFVTRGLVLSNYLCIGMQELKQPLLRSLMTSRRSGIRTLCQPADLKHQFRKNEVTEKTHPS